MALDLNTLEATLQKQQWVGGQNPSSADKETFEAMKTQELSAESHPHAFAWFCLVWKFSDQVRNGWAAAGAAKGGKGGKQDGGKKGGKGKEKKEEKKADDDDLDLFGDDDDDGEAAKEAAKKAKEAATG